MDFENVHGFGVAALAIRRVEFGQLHGELPHQKRTAPPGTSSSRFPRRLFSALCHASSQQLLSQRLILALADNVLDVTFLGIVVRGRQRVFQFSWNDKVGIDQPHGRHDRGVRSKCLGQQLLGVELGQLVPIRGQFFGRPGRGPWQRGPAVPSPRDRPPSGRNTRPCRCRNSESRPTACGCRNVPGGSIPRRPL